MTPPQVQRLLEETEGRLSVHVQPSARRVFADQEYRQAGAVVQEDLTASDIIMGVKRPTTVLEDKTYLFFSHTIKGQPENMPLLQECLDKNVQLIDYERITAVRKCGKKEGKSKRLVSFGRFAGIAGTMDSFHHLGRKMLYTHGASTPFLSFPPAIMHDNLEDAKDRVLRLGERVFYEGVQYHEPIVFAVTGKGGCVHGGVMEILQMLPHEIVPVSDLAAVLQQQHPETQHKIHVVPVGIEDVFQRRNGDPCEFERQDFQKHPSEYRSLFAKRVAPYSHVIVNCAYWDARFPRLLTKQQMKRLYEVGNQRFVRMQRSDRMNE